MDWNKNSFRVSLVVEAYIGSYNNELNGSIWMYEHAGLIGNIYRASLCTGMICL